MIEKVNPNTTSKCGVVSKTVQVFLTIAIDNRTKKTYHSPIKTVNPLILMISVAPFWDIRAYITKHKRLAINKSHKNSL
jgi:hypothetical protein